MINRAPEIKTRKKAEVVSFIPSDFHFMNFVQQMKQTVAIFKSRKPLRMTRWCFDQSPQRKVMT